MAGLLQFYFFPTDFYYPRPQPVNSTSQKQQAQKELAEPASLQPQKQKDSIDIHDQDHSHHILENQEKPLNGLALRCNGNRLVLKGSGGTAAAASNFSTIYELQKPDKDLIRAVMFEDYGF